MSKQFGSRIAGGNSAYGRNKSDFYPTPPEPTSALLKLLDIPKTAVIWEPACGQGDMVQEMQRCGYAVIATDIQYGTDFLTSQMACDWIITNPPFSLAEEFIRHCLELKKPFCLLLKSQFWHAKKRLPLFREHPPAAICPLTWRPDFLFGTRGSGSPLMDVMWVVWHPEETKTRYYPIEKPTDVEMA